MFALFLLGKIVFVNVKVKLLSKVYGQFGLSDFRSFGTADSLVAEWREYL